MTTENKSACWGCRIYRWISARDCSISIANTLESLQACTKPLIGEHIIPSIVHKLSQVWVAECGGMRADHTFYHAVWKGPGFEMWYGPLARYVLRVAHVPGMPGTFSLTPWVSDPVMYHGTCVTHVPWCMPWSLTSSFLWSRWPGTVPVIPGACATHNFTYLHGKRPMGTSHTFYCVDSRSWVVEKWHGNQSQFLFCTSCCRVRVVEYRCQQLIYRHIVKKCMIHDKM